MGFRMFSRYLVVYPKMSLIIHCSPVVILITVAVWICDVKAEEEFLLLNSSTSILSYFQSQFSDNEPKEDIPDPFKAGPLSRLGYHVPCGVRGEVPIRIVGGTNALPGEFPWQVSLQMKSGWMSHHFCGGTILSAYWVVTAAHCVSNLHPSTIAVVAGDYDFYKIEGREQKVSVSRILTPYNRKSVNFRDDIALLQLASPLQLDGERIAPICLPAKGQVFRGEGIVTGWGRLSETGALPHILQEVPLPLIPTPRCHAVYRGLGFSSYLHKCQLCSGLQGGGADACQGDSGGPLICLHSDDRYYLCGVVSWGVGCARPNMPGIYTQVSCYTDWIISIMYNVHRVLDGLSAEQKFLDHPSIVQKFTEEQRNNITIN